MLFLPSADFWFGLLLLVPVNSYGHVGTVSSPNLTFFLGKLDYALTSNLCAYFRLKLTRTLLESPEGGKWSEKLFHDQSPRKYGTGHGSNSRPLDLQSDTLQTALLSRVVTLSMLGNFSCFFCHLLIFFFQN